MTDLIDWYLLIFNTPYCDMTPAKNFSLYAPVALFFIVIIYAYRRDRR